MYSKCTQTLGFESEYSTVSELAVSTLYPQLSGIIKNSYC